MCYNNKIIFADRHIFITLPKQVMNLPFAMNCPENSVISVIEKGYSKNSYPYITYPKQI